MTQSSLLLVVLLLSCSVCIDRGVGQLVGDNTRYRPGQCLPGGRHKELACPEPEGVEYEACFQWRDETCCTAEFTQQLSQPVISNVFEFRWDTCGNLTPSCQEYFKRVECFYRCSPHVAHWTLNQFSALGNLPVCREFCDGWFQACANDMTCATNWITDWDYVLNGVNVCRENSTCRNFTEVYGNGRGLCETLWGQSFIYSNYSETESNRQCMTLYWPDDQPNPNLDAIRNLFGDQVDTVTPAPCAACGLVSHILPLLAIAIFLTFLVL